MIFRVILTRNGQYLKTLHRCKTRETAFIRYHGFKEVNKSVIFPKKKINDKCIKTVNYQICVTKPTEPTDKFRMLRNTLGMLYEEPPLGDWTILDSSEYLIEETFWVFPYSSKRKDRLTLKSILPMLFKGGFKSNLVKQVIVVHNKLIIYSEDQFEMIICKCIEDAQRLHHTLAKAAKKQKIKTLLFMGTATPASISNMYEIIKEETGWPIEKIRRTSTRP